CQKAGEVPGAPNWLKPIAATTLAQGGDRRSSRTMWLAILQSAEHDWLHTQAQRRLLQLKALDEMDAIQSLLNKFAESTGRPVTDWETFDREGRKLGLPTPTRSVPSDPGG